MKTFIEEIGDAAMLEMLAEECAELDGEDGGE